MPTNEQFANALATDILSVKHSLYNLVARPFGYEATFVENERGNYETRFVETNDSFLAASAKYGLDALSVLTFGRGGGSNAFLAKTPGKPALTNQAKNLFNASDDLVASLADKIEGVTPGRVQNVERIIKGSDGRIKTDFDIELDNVVVEVTRGGGKGKVSQVLNKIQPETSKNVVVFGPNLKPSVQKELTNQGVQFFTKEEDLINFINQ